MRYIGSEDAKNNIVLFILITCFTTIKLKSNWNTASDKNTIYINWTIK